MFAGDRGFVTAESAVVLPVLVAFAMALVWGLLVMSAQIRCVDAARAGARAAARQDPADAVLAVARATAPRGAEVRVSREGDQVRVVVVAKPPALRALPFEVREEAVAAAEDAPAATGEGSGAARGSGAGADADTRPASGQASGQGPGSGPRPGPKVGSGPGLGSVSGPAPGPGPDSGAGPASEAGP